MKFFFKNKILILFALLFVLSVLPFAFSQISCSTNEVLSKKEELFRPELIKINSMDKLITYSDSVYHSTGFEFDTSRYVHILSLVIKERFRHGLAQYTFSENWIANVSSKLFWRDISAIVAPNDILKHQIGLCSQQTIVFMEALKLKGIRVRSVGLGYKEGPGHFLCETWYNNEWHLNDVSMEPHWNEIGNSHKEMEYYLANKDTLYKVYEHIFTRSVFNKLTERVVYGQVNEFSAKNMFLFHQICRMIAYFLPIFFILMFSRSFSKAKKQENKSVSVRKQTKEVILS